MAPCGELEVGNHARCGAPVEDVAADRLPRVLAQRPAYASVPVGANGTLRGWFEPALIAVRPEETVAALRGIGTVVLTAGLPDPGGGWLRVPEVVDRPLARRVRGINAVFKPLAVTYGTIHIDSVRHPAIYDAHMWGSTGFIRASVVRRPGSAAGSAENLPGSCPQARVRLDRNG
jgi:hypothetical protein